jgi:hypothetical protein
VTSQTALPQCGDDPVVSGTAVKINGSVQNSQVTFDY